MSKHPLRLASFRFISGYHARSKNGFFLAFSHHPLFTVKRIFLKVFHMGSDAARSTERNGIWYSTCVAVRCVRLIKHVSSSSSLSNTYLKCPKQLQLLQGSLFREKNRKMKIGRRENVIQSQTVSQQRRNKYSLHSVLATPTATRLM